MKKYLPVIGVLAFLKISIQWVGNQRYGFHRDELLHLSVSEHLDWGYFEFPPLIAVLGKASTSLFGYTLWGTRLFPTLAGAAILILCCLMAYEMGGKFKAVLLAGICILSFLPFYRNHTLFQPVAFDQLWWTLGFYAVIRCINTGHYKWLLLVGMVSGIGLLNKYTMVVWCFGVVIGLFFYQGAAVYKTWWPYLAGLLALVFIGPNVFWQAQHDFPFLQHLQLLKEKQLDGASPFEFGLVQLYFPFTFAISIVGTSAFFMDQELKKYRSLGIATLVIFVTLWALHSKAYYVFAIYPVLFAAGAVKIERLIAYRKRAYVILVGIMVTPALLLIPELTPVLPIERYVQFFHKEEVDGRVHLTGDYADMFGWEEQVQVVDSVYRSLPEAERKNCVLWAENYGEAGALKILGKKYGLPKPICRHGSFWLWGYSNPRAAVWISVGNEKNAVDEVFAETQLIRMITHKYAMEEENNIPLYLCRKPRVNFATWWGDYREHVFD